MERTRQFETDGSDEEVHFDTSHAYWTGSPIPHFHQAPPSPIPHQHDYSRRLQELQLMSQGTQQSETVSGTMVSTDGIARPLMDDLRGLQFNGQPDMPVYPRNIDLGSTEASQEPISQQQFVANVFPPEPRPPWSAFSPVARQWPALEYPIGNPASSLLHVQQARHFQGIFPESSQGLTADQDYSDTTSSIDPRTMDGEASTAPSYDPSNSPGFPSGQGFWSAQQVGSMPQQPDPRLFPEAPYINGPFRPEHNSMPNPVAHSMPSTLGRHSAATAANPKYLDPMVPRVRERSLSGSQESSGGTPLTPEIFCSLCRARFSGEYRKGNRARHMRMFHSGLEGIQKEFECEARNCDRLFKRKDARLKHYRKYHKELVDRPFLPRK